MIDGKAPLRDIPRKWTNSHQIYTDDVVNQTWIIFENLSSVKYLENIIRKRINDNYMKNLTNNLLMRIKKKDFMSSQKMTVLEDDDVTNVVPEARNIILQAKDIFFASSTLPLLSKPILLFYCFEKLAQLLYIITYKNIPTKYQHGLKYDRETHLIRFYRDGLFPNFHNSFSEDPIYLDENSIRFEDIIECGPIFNVELDFLAFTKNTYKIKTVDNNHILLTELDREFLFLYGLSILARYNVLAWSNILSGEQIHISEDIKVINHMRSFAKTVETMFPSLILNEIYLMKLSIFSPARIMATEFENYNDKALP